MREFERSQKHPSSSGLLVSEVDPSHLLLQLLHRLVRKLSSRLGLFQLARQVLDVLLVRLLPLVRLLLCHLPIIIFQAFVLAERDNCLE